MKMFEFLLRNQQNAKQIPHLRVDAAHLTSPGKLRASKGHLIFESQEAKQLRLDVEELREIVSYDELTVTLGAMQLLREHDISLSYLTKGGSFLLARMSHDHADRTLTRLLQYSAYEDSDWQLSVARQIVVEKIDSILTAARHYQRQGKKPDGRKLSQLLETREAVATVKSVAELRGFEGRASAIWFEQLPKLLSKGWEFPGRRRRPPTDPVNALLSFGYMMLYRRAVARIEAAGYEAALGALHEFRPGRMSMGCDVMEPLRIPVVDRFVLAVLAQGIVRKDWFELPATDGGIYLKRERFGDFIGRFEEHWHQNHFQQHIEAAIQRWGIGLRERVSEEGSRTAAYIKRKAVKERGSGESQGYAP